MKRTIAMILILIMASTSFVYAESKSRATTGWLGGLLGNWLGGRVESGVDKNQSIQNVGKALDDIEIHEEYVKTKRLFENRIPVMSNEEVQEFKKQVDDLTGEKGKEFESKARQVSSLKQRIKSKNKLSADDHKKLQKWLQDNIDLREHPLFDGNYLDSNINITVMPLPTQTVIPAKAPILSPVF